MTGLWWCKIWHRQITRPFRGEYTCLECLRKHPVKWGASEERQAELQIETQMAEAGR